MTKSHLLYPARQWHKMDIVGERVQYSTVARAYFTDLPLLVGIFMNITTAVT